MSTRRLTVLAAAFLLACAPGCQWILDIDDPVVGGPPDAALGPDADLAALLSDLQLSEGTLAPAFAPDTLEYTVAVANSVESLTVTPTAGSGSASITVIGGGAGNPVPSGTASPPIALEVGSNSISVVVNPNNGSDPSTYSIDVQRAD
jgi:hypothetical protein